MTGRKLPDDFRLNVARYQVDKLTREDGVEPEDDTNTAGQSTMESRAQFVEIAIQQAQRRGDFENLPGAGKPLPNLRDTTDPDWWFRRKIERERITGLGPPALTLRTEDRDLDARLDATSTVDAVRELLVDFNTRVVEAQRQLLGGPPVVTSPRRRRGNRALERPADGATERCGAGTAAGGVGAGHAPVARPVACRARGYGRSTAARMTRARSSGRVNWGQCPVGSPT
jgi:hypothetical protein